MKYLIALTFSICCVHLTAQNVDFKKANFKDDKDGLKNALIALDTGDEFFEKGKEKVLAMKSAVDDFKAAISQYEIAQSFNSENVDLNRKIGHAFLYTNEAYLSKDFLLKSLDLSADVNPMLYFLLGKSYQLENDFETAQKYFLQFRSNADKKSLELYSKLNKKHIKECENGKETSLIKRRTWVDNVVELNTQDDEISPCISADRTNLIFTSNRSGNNDIYQAERIARKWKNIKPIDHLNTDEDEVASSLAYDGQRILLFKYNEGQADIYQSILDGDSWSAPKLKMSKVVNTEANETFASFDPQDIKVYYVSDGGHGGDQDIIFSGKKDDEEKYWGKGQSAGHEVNSSYHEGSVYMAPDGQTMYFSSQGHSSIGGFDIFVSYRDKQGLWGEPVNLGAPINSPYDESYFTISANGKYAYFSSNRVGGSGGMDIYKATFWGEPKKPIVNTEDHLIASLTAPVVNTYVPQSVEVSERNSLTVFKGKILDGLLQTPVAAEIKIYNNATGEMYTKVNSNSATGKFLLSLPSGLNYGISVEAEGYLFHSENFNLPHGSAYNMVSKDIKLKNIDIGSKIALRNVFFKSGKSEVQIDSYPELDRLIQLMIDVPTLKIELSGHTDNVGNEEYNLNLSQRRADAVRTYLTSRGVDKNRVTAVGYGITRPVESNDNADGRASNRRTEFEITDN